MSLTEPSARRLKPVRLTDIPLAVRYHAAVVAAKRARNPEEAQELFAAALSPSDKVYFVTPDAQVAA